jgi:hypothetical protein
MLGVFGNSAFAYFFHTHAEKIYTVPLYMLAGPSRLPRAVLFFSISIFLNSTRLISPTLFPIHSSQEIGQREDWRVNVLRHGASSLFKKGSFILLYIRLLRKNRDIFCIQQAYIVNITILKGGLWCANSRKLLILTSHCWNLNLGQPQTTDTNLWQAHCLA